jgi:hypothetical protein
MNIQALDVRRVNNQTLKAFCRLQIEDFGMVINDVKLFVKGENHWAHGEKKYFPYIQFTNKDIEKEILKTAADLMLKELEVGEMGAQYAV